LFATVKRFSRQIEGSLELANQIHHSPLRASHKRPAVAAEVAKLSPEVLIASPLLRTRETAEAIASIVDLPITFDEAWFECSFGAWDGMSIEEVKLAYPREYQAWVSSSAYPPPQGESYDALGWRIDEAPQ